MDDLTVKVMKMSAAGFCCTQIVVGLGLELQGQVNTPLLRALSGACKGLRDCSQACGALTGGMCLLALYAGRGEEIEDEHPEYSEMTTKLMVWFGTEAEGQYGGIRCRDILGPGVTKPVKEKCGPLVVRTFGKCMEILAEHGVDPSLTKEELGV